MEKKYITTTLFIFFVVLYTLLMMPQFFVFAQCQDAAGASIPCPQQDGGEDGGKEKKATRIPPPTNTSTPTLTSTSTSTATPTETPTAVPLACPTTDPLSEDNQIPGSAECPLCEIILSTPDGRSWIFGGIGLALGLTGGLATPGVINWLRASAKDSNLFSEGGKGKPKKKRPG